MKQILYKILGLISLALGIVGIFFPVLPTTPFLLLASWLFLRSSEKLYHWLMDHPVLGIYIKSYTMYKGIRKEHKIFAVATLWLTISISIYLVDPLPVKILLFVIALGVTIHLLSFRTLTKKEMEEISAHEEELRRKKEEARERQATEMEKA